MMKLLYGMYPIDSGEFIIKGERITKLDPGTAIARGIGMVHQEFMLVNELTVLENVILASSRKKALPSILTKPEKKSDIISTSITWKFSWTKRSARFL